MQNEFIPFMSMVRIKTTQYVFRPATNSYDRIAPGTHCRMLFYYDDGEGSSYYAVSISTGDSEGDSVGDRLELAPWLIELVDDDAHPPSSE